MQTPTSTQPHTRQTVYYLEWLDFGPTGNTPKWETMAFPNYEDETTDRAYAMKCYQDIAAQDPDRVRLVQEDQRVQVIAASSLETSARETLTPQETGETEVMPVWLTARQLTLLNYLCVMQRRQLAESSDPEPIANAIQTDGRPIAERAGFLTMQVLQLLAAVELTHYRLVFIANHVTTPEQMQAMVTAWRQCLPTAVIYQYAFENRNDCIVWHLYVPAKGGKPTDEQRATVISAALKLANVDFDHQEPVYGNAYWEFMTQHPGGLVSPIPTPSLSPVGQTNANGNQPYDC